MYTISHHYMSVSRSVTPCPAQSFCVNCICMSVHPPIRHIHTHNVFHICLCFCVHMSVYHVHSHVSVCLSATFMYTIRPFRTFLRLSVDLRVFCVCLFSCKYIRCTVVCPSACYIRAPSSQYMSVCLAVHSSKFRQCL